MSKNEKTNEEAETIIASKFFHTQESLRRKRSSMKKTVNQEGVKKEIQHDESKADTVVENVPEKRFEIPKKTPVKSKQNAKQAKLFKHRNSMEALTSWNWQESRVLIIYTGGTIGMINNSMGKLAPQSGELEARIRKYPHMHDDDYATERFKVLSNPPLVLPDCREKRRVVYWVHEYSPLLDSSNMTMDDWIRIGRDIRALYEDFDGFVVLHGTDTLAYTAAALSFMLQDLGKPIVITGSQIPLFETRSDGRDNFIGSVIMAGSYNIPEVTVFFNNKLFRGNRTAKVSTGSLNAFDSLNFPPLAVAGISITVEHRNIFRPVTLNKFSIFSELNRDVGLLRIFPSIMVETVRSFLQPPIQGAVLQTYGSGNIPSNRTDLIEVFKEASERGVLVVNISQCMHGGVDVIYETGAILENAGVISGLDMTPEAALAKLSYVLAKEKDFEKRKKMMASNLRGEMSVASNTPDNEPDEMVDDIVGAISKAMEMTSGEDRSHLQELLVPNLFNNAVLNGDIVKMEKLLHNLLDINGKDAMGTTALHLAASEGNVEVVEWLLLHGALVHVRDIKGHSALWVAVSANNTKVIELLVRTGAHLIELPTRIGEALVTNAATGNILRLESFLKAGADINTADTLGRTALHAACTVGSKLTVEFLMKNGADPRRKDKTNLTPGMCAQINEFDGLVTLCKTHQLKDEKLLEMKEILE